MSFFVLFMIMSFVVFGSIAAYILSKTKDSTPPYEEDAEGLHFTQNELDLMDENQRLREELDELKRKNKD